ncbi:MAG: hypothetical protein ACI376_06875 [Candidatus Bruticola sp.]
MLIYDRVSLLSQAQVSSDKYEQLCFGINLLEKVRNTLQNISIPLLKLPEFWRGRIFIVGGALRNLAWNYPVKDWDLIIEGGAPHDTARLSRRFCDVCGAAWVVLDHKRGFYRAVFTNENTDVDFCALRGAFLEDDLKDRDFTINSLAYSITENIIYDEKQSLVDLYQRKLAPVSPSCLFNDPLRALRALRLGIAYHLTWDNDLSAQVAHTLQSEIGRVAEERVGSELAAVLQCSLTEQLSLLADCAFPQFLCGAGTNYQLEGHRENSSWLSSEGVVLLIALEREQHTGWPKLKHSGKLLQHYLKLSVKGGRSFLVLLKMALLCPSYHLEKKQNRYKLSVQELKVIFELKQAASELCNLLSQRASRRQYYNFLTKVKFFPCLIALNYLWKLFQFQEKDKGKLSFNSVGNLSNQDDFPLASDNSAKLCAYHEDTSWSFLLDCLLLDYLKNGTLSCPVVPIDGHLLQKELNISPGPQLGKILAALSAECSEHFMSKNEALSWVKNHLACE